MSELTIIQNADEVTNIIIGKGYSYFLTPSFKGIYIKELKTKFYAKMQLVCNFITNNSSEIKLTVSSETTEYAVKVEGRRPTWANVVTINGNNIVLIYISDKESDGKTNTGTYTLYSTHHSYDITQREEMVRLSKTTDKTNINALVSNEKPVLFNKLQIINDSVISNMGAHAVFAGHANEVGNGGGGGGGGGYIETDNIDKWGRWGTGCCNKSADKCTCAHWAGGGAKKRRKSRQKKRRNQRNTKRRKSRSRRHHQ